MNKKQRHLFTSFILVCFITCKVIAQSSDKIPDQIVTLDIPIGKAIDSLIDEDFKTLEAKFYNANPKNKIREIYAQAYIHRAKRLKDTIEIANGYNLMTKISSPEIEFKYLDSMIAITQNINHLNYPSRGYLNKGVYYFDQEKNDKALEHYLIAKKYAEQNNNTLHLVAINNNIGLLKKAVGNKEEALAIFKNNLEFIKSQDTINTYKDTYITTLFAIADSYHRMEQADSASYYVNLGLEKSLKHKEKYMYTTFLMLSGINNNYKREYSKGLDSLKKASRIIKENKALDLNLSVCYFQIARSLIGLGQEDESIPYLQKIDSMVQPENYAAEERQAFELLINHYKKTDDKENQIRLLNKLITMDSLFNEKNKNLKSDIVRKYDVVPLIREREAIINSLEKGKRQSFYISSFISLVAIVSIILFIFYYRKQKIYRSRFEKIVKKPDIQNHLQENRSAEHSQQSLDISDDVINELLEKLKRFENDKEYINPKLSLNILAKKFKTNSSYLSKIINIYKDKNFTNYVNDLRIDHCVEQLKFDKKFRLYSITSIASEVGFNSVQSFSRAFYKKLGIYPSYFIKNIEKQQFTQNPKDKN